MNRITTIGILGIICLQSYMWVESRCVLAPVPAVSIADSNLEKGLGQVMAQVRVTREPSSSVGIESTKMQRLENRALIQSHESAVLELNRILKEEKPEWKVISDQLERSFSCHGRTALLCAEVISFTVSREGFDSSLDRLQAQIDLEMNANTREYLANVNEALRDESLSPKVIESLKSLKAILIDDFQTQESN